MSNEAAPVSQEVHTATYVSNSFASSLQRGAPTFLTLNGSPLYVAFEGAQAAQEQLENAPKSSVILLGRTSHVILPAVAEEELKLIWAFTLVSVGLWIAQHFFGSTDVDSGSSYFSFVTLVSTVVAYFVHSVILLKRGSVGVYGAMASMSTIFLKLGSAVAMVSHISLTTERQSILVGAQFLSQQILAFLCEKLESMSGGNVVPVPAHNPG